MIARVPGEAGLRVALELERSSIMTDSWDTEASVLLKVQRILKGEERYLVGDPFGGLMKLMAQKNRDDFAAALKNDQLKQLGVGDIEITAPAIIGTPIAIYR